MYQDPRNIRKHAVKVSLSDDEALFLDRCADLAGCQKSAYLRELALERLRELSEQSTQDNDRKGA